MRRFPSLRWTAVVCLFAASTAHSADEPKPAAGPQKPRVTVGKDTTRLLAPLDAEGYVDYLTALNQRYREGVTPENNAAVPLWKAIGPKAIQAGSRGKFFEWLGIAAPPEDGKYFVSFEEFTHPDLAALGEEERTARKTRLVRGFEAAQRRPWKAAEFPELARWLEAIDGPLALAVESAERPKSFRPLVSADEQGPALISALLPGLSEVRGLARALCIRAMARLAAHQPDAAWRDLLAVQRLARHSGQGSTLIEGLVEIAVEGLGQQGLAAFAHHAQAPPEAWAGYRRDWAALPPPLSMARRLDEGERNMYLDAVTSLARMRGDVLGLLGENAEVAWILAKVQQTIGLDYDLILRRGNALYDRLVKLAEAPQSAERTRGLKEFEQELRELKVQATDLKGLALRIVLGQGRAVISEKLSDVLVSMLFPAVLRVLEAEDRAAAQRRLAEAALALGAYRAAHREYPAKWELLAPQFLPAPPRDPFAQGALQYRRTERGFVLYSVGPNGIDNGGRTREQDAEQRGFDDLVVEQPYAPPAEPR